MRCQAHHTGRIWIATATSPRVYTHARTLRELDEQVGEAAALALGTPTEEVTVSLQLTFPELEALSTAKADYEAACAEAVRRLRAQGVTWADTARATGLTQGQARRYARG